MKQLFAYLKTKWGISRLLDFILIMTVFALAGLTESMAARPIITHLFHLSRQTPLWFRILVFVLFFVPLYQCFLLLYGLLLGQFKFFWEREKQIGWWLFRFVQRKSRGILYLLGLGQSEKV